MSILWQCQRIENWLFLLVLVVGVVRVVLGVGGGSSSVLVVVVIGLKQKYIKNSISIKSEIFYLVILLRLNLLKGAISRT